MRMDRLTSAGLRSGMSVITLSFDSCNFHVHLYQISKASRRRNRCVMRRLRDEVAHLIEKTLNRAVE
jgi:hypothetical protein